MSGFRRCGRKPLRCAVKFDHRVAGNVVAETQDVSDSGLFIRSEGLSKILSVGDTFNAQLECNLSEGEDPSVTVEKTQLKVVRTTEDGIGLVFE